MCIIVVKKIGVEMPSYETLETCFRNNDDGAGFMYADGKTVRIRKGFMKFDDFVDAINEEFADKPVKDYALVMHFRIATSGDTLQCCTHPFPITSDKEKLSKLSCESRWGIAHNGVIHGRETRKGWSDTMDFVAGVVTPLAHMNANFMRNDDALDLLESACNSKLAILENSGEIATVGKFYEVDGVLYSNTTYLDYTYRYTSYADAWSGYDIAYRDYYGLPSNTDLYTMIDALPFMACKVCDCAEECALVSTQCASEKEAIENCAFWGEMDVSEVVDLLGIEIEDEEQMTLL